MKRKTKIGCLSLLGLVAGLCVALVFVAYLGLKKAANSIPMEQLPLASGTTEGGEPAGEAGGDVPATGWELVRNGLTEGGTTLGSILKGELRFLVPGGLWQNEVRQMFPIEETVAGLVSVSLSNPIFVADPDPQRLRLHLSLTARMLEGESLQFPGRLSIRARLRFNRSTQTVVLTDSQLAEFSFSGEAAEVAADLRDVLAEAISAELEGFEVFRFPKGGGWWAESGKAMVREVVVENGGVVVVAGW